MTSQLKTAIKCKHRVYSKYVKRGCKAEEWEHVKTLSQNTSQMITSAKEKCFLKLGQKLSDPANGVKACWSTLNKIINRNKVINIPPLLVNGVFIMNYQTKADVFNEFFAKQCSLLPNDSSIPAFTPKCDNILSSAGIDRLKVLSLIHYLDSKKAHKCDDLSITMLNICDLTIVEPLSLIYEKCFESGKYPSLWKKANILPIHKTESCQLEKNYRLISMLPICAKLFEKLIFDKVYDHLVKNDLLTPKQSGFHPGDSTINQLLSVTYCIYTAFEEFPSGETRAVFLDISKAFDKVWHEGLLFKLECNDVSDPLLATIRSYLSYRIQRVVLNGKMSKWTSVTTGVRQGSVLGPLFFLIYINDLVDNLSSEAKVFADEALLFSVVYDESVTAEKLNKDLETIYI